MRLADLIAEKLRRRHASAADHIGPAAESTSPIQANAAGPTLKLSAAARAWEDERSEAAKRPESLEAGEIANMIEGLTPSGKDRQGRQVSFVEHDHPRRRGISDSRRPLHE